MTSLRIGICGITGRMGRTLVRIIQDTPGMEIAGGVASSDDVEAHDGVAYNVVTPDACTNIIEASDVIIDFSSPAALTTMLDVARDSLNGKALVIGTTGLNAQQESAIERAANSCAVVTAANFSIGVNLLLDLVKRAASVLDDRFDIEIVESHHRNKVDAPSGTALALGRAAAEGRNVDLHDVRIDGRTGDAGKRPSGQIAFHALRGGAVVGEHHVQFLGDVERIELTHIATDRVLFANGAIAAAQWVRDKKPGRYTMRDVLGLNE